MTLGVEDWDRPVRALVREGRGPSRDVIEALVGTRQLQLGGAGVRAETEAVERSVLGLGPLDDLLGDVEVTDILVNGDGRVWVDRGRGVERAGLTLPVEHLRLLAVRLAGLAGRRLDDAQPWVDGRLPEGIRLHAVLPPLVEGGAHISLRIPRVSPRSMGALVAMGACAAEVADLLGAVVRSGLGFLVCGGTGTGKTTLLGGLLSEVPHAERLVVVEDVTELDPSHPHAVRLQGRSANVEGQGCVTMVDLVRQALRMRPDRLIVGEVRGAEVRELLAALNTGHGGAGTVHANCAADVPSRFHALGALAGIHREAVDLQFRSAVDVVIAMTREGAVRRVAEVAVTDTDPDGRVVVVPCAVVPRDGEVVRSVGWPLLSARLAARLESCTGGGVDDHLGASPASRVGAKAAPRPRGERA